MPIPFRPWSPLSDEEWRALSPFLRLSGPGRPVHDLRARLDAMFQAVTSGLPWSAFRSAAGSAGTIHRHFRRLAHAGLWTRLLRAIAARGCPRALAAIASWIAAAYRRAIRLLGLSAITLARRLGVDEALPGPPWMVPDPDLSGTVHRIVLALLRGPARPDLPRLLRLCRSILRTAEGRRRIPACLIPR